MLTRVLPVIGAAACGVAITLYTFAPIIRYVKSFFLANAQNLKFVLFSHWRVLISSCHPTDTAKIVPYLREQQEEMQKLQGAAGGSPNTSSNPQAVQEQAKSK